MKSATITCLQRLLMTSSHCIKLCDSSLTECGQVIKDADVHTNVIESAMSREVEPSEILRYFVDHHFRALAENLPQCRHCRYCAPRQTQ